MRGGEPARPTHLWGSLTKVLPWVLPYWPIMLFGLCCMLLSVFIDKQQPRVVQYIIDVVIKQEAYDHTTRVVLLLVGIIIGSHLFGFLRTYTLHIAGQRVLHDLRVKLYQHMQRLSLTYFDNRQTGDLMSRMTGDVAEIEHLMVHGFDVLVMGLFGMVLSLYYIAHYSPTLALLVLVPVPVLAVSIFFFSKAVRTVYRGIRDRMGDLNAKIQDNIAGIRVVKAFSREETELTQVTHESDRVMAMNVRGIRLWAPFGPAMGVVGGMGSVLVLLVGIHLCRTEQLQIGALVACILYLITFYQPIGMLFQFFDSIQRSLAAGERLVEVLEADLDIKDPAAPTPLEVVRGEVAFHHVSFRYADGDEVLRDVTLTVAPGQRVALVGRSGAGKSSFINLIPRFYDALEGSVQVDGIDVRTVRQADLRRHIALVLQETFLFNGTVKENLRYGRLEATDEELVAAARVANADEFITRLPNGYDTEIGERGIKLSGGQKQRLAIARAVLADPRILILDEATSSVDSESEFFIHQALERLMEGRTTFIIAHRLSTIKHADVILVLENGTIIERGEHEDLLRANGVYAQMYRQQFWLDELPEDAQLYHDAAQPETPPSDLPTLY
jgi:subfamily B ATP-binding cassette protein MsbA